MRYLKSYSIFLAIALALFAVIAKTHTLQNGQSHDLTTLSDSDLSAITISFERTGCYGNCPAYTVTLIGDGSVEYVGKDNVKVKGKQMGHVDRQVIKALVAEFSRSGFESISDDYSYEKCKCALCTDMPSAITRLTVKGSTHSVNHYYGCRCASKQLFALEAAIDKAINVEQWTGDVSKSGPVATTCSGG